MSLTVNVDRCSGTRPDWLEPCDLWLRLPALCELDLWWLDDLCVPPALCELDLWWLDHLCVPPALCELDLWWLDDLCVRPDLCDDFEPDDRFEDDALLDDEELLDECELEELDLDTAGVDVWLVDPDDFGECLPWDRALECAPSCRALVTARCGFDIDW